MMDGMAVQILMIEEINMSNKTPKQPKQPVLFNGSDIIIARPTFDYYGKIIGYDLVLED